MTLRAAAFAALSGVLLAATFPDFNFHLLAWIALVPLLLSLKGQAVKTGFLLGGITGLIFFAGTVHWVSYSLHVYGNVALVLSLLITLLLCAYLAIYPAVFAALAVFTGQRRPGILILVTPALWTSLELARTYLFTGFPWALLGYSQYSMLPLIQIADTTGVYGISFLIVLVNAALAAFITDRKKTREILSAGLVIVLVLGYGFMRLSRSEAAGSITISVIQGNIEQDKKWDPAYQSETIAAYKILTGEALKHHPDLVIWPETSTPFYFIGDDVSDRQMSSDLVEFVKRKKVSLLFGSATYETTQPGSFILRNSAFLLSKRGEVAARYDKLHLVPFGEYVPLKSIFFFVQKMVQSSGDFSAGNDYTLMTVPSGASAPVKISTVICYEIIFPDLVRKFIDRGASILTTITNDAWFGKTAAPYQHFSIAVYRAVENRVPVARAANTGVSGFIDAKGHILEASDIFTQAHMTRQLTPGALRTFYTRFGDIFSYVCLLFSIVIVLLAKKSY